MDVRRAKQIIYGAFYLLIVFGIGAWIYGAFFHAAPSCFDGIRNQGELGVDCGGPCIAACIPSDLRKISLIGGVSVFSSSPGHDTLLVQIANTNAGYAARKFGYRFDLYDAAGAPLGSIPGGSYLYAGESKYIVVPNLPVAQTVARASFSVENPDWAAANDLGITPNFRGLQVTGSEISSSTLTVRGRIVNADVASFDRIDIVAILRGTGGEIVGASATLVDHLAPSESQDFSVMYPASNAVDPARTQFYAYALRE